MTHETEQTPAADEGRLEPTVRRQAMPTHGPWYAATADEWRTANGEHVQYGRFDISAGSNDPTAENYYRIASVSNVNNSWRNQANAKLIAAAPDLLDVVQALVLAQQQGCDPALMVAEDSPLMDAARDALRKVCGVPAA